MRGGAGGLEGNLQLDGLGGDGARLADEEVQWQWGCQTVSHDDEATAEPHLALRRDDAWCCFVV